MKNYFYAQFLTDCVDEWEEQECSQFPEWRPDYDSLTDAILEMHDEMITEIMTWMET